MKITEFKICYDVQISMAFLTELDATIAETYPSSLVHWLHRNRHDALAFLEKGEAQFDHMPKSHNKNTGIIILIGFSQKPGDVIIGQGIVKRVVGFQ